MQATLATDTETDIRIIPLIQAAGLREVGGKASRLADLMAAGEHVPDGFCVVGQGDPAVAAALAAYRRMGTDVPVAVRSSASAEDGREASFAGQFETVLGVRGEQELAAALAACWRSLRADRAAAYAKRRGLEGSAASLTMSVLVQRMVAARTAGVAFSADPLTGARDVVVVHAVNGLGDRLVSGRGQSRPLPRPVGRQCRERTGRSRPAGLDR